VERLLAKVGGGRELGTGSEELDDLLLGEELEGVPVDFTGQHRLTRPRVIEKCVIVNGSLSTRCAQDSFPDM
jgi:hypothetical protein